MDIYSALRFVQGAVAKKNYDPSLTHFRIDKGTVRSYNGVISLSSPIAIDISVSPKAVPLVKAIQASKDVIKLNVTPTGRLSVQSGKFRAFVECLQDGEFPDMAPEGVVVDISGIDFLKALKRVAPFIAEDASRQWARGVLFRGQSLLATNNIILVEHWLPVAFPVEMNLPEEAVNELLRIGRVPKSMQLSGTSVTFHFDDDCWLKSRLYATAWPDVSRVLDVTSEQKELPEEFFTVLEKLAPFSGKEERVYFRDGIVTTSIEESTGATEQLDVASDGCFNIHQLRTLSGIVETIDFSSYPRPSLFYGQDIRGTLVGIRG